MRTTKSCGPDAPTLASSSRMASRPYRARTSHTSADDGGKKARSPGRARSKPLKPLRAGMPGDSGVLVVTRVLSTNAKCTRGCGCSGHPAFPTPSLGAEDSSTARAHCAAGSRTCVMNTIAPRSEPSSSAKADDPVFRGTSDGARRPQRTGYSAFAEYDGLGEKRPRDKAFFARDQLGCAFAQRTATDIRSHERYINPARHRVRAFGVGWIWQNDGIDTIERRPRRPPQAAVVSLLASRHPRNGPYSRPLCRRRDRNPHRCRIGSARASDRGARPRPLCRGERQYGAGGRIRQRPVRPDKIVSIDGSRRMKSPTRPPAELLVPGRALTFANVAEGAEGLVVSDLARAVAARPKPPAVSLAVVCRDGARMQQLARALEFFASDLPVMQFPAWDCQPYDRVSPHGGILAQRLTTLARLSRLEGSEKPLIVLTTVNAIVQRVPAREIIAAQALSVAPGHVVPMDSIVSWLEHNGYNRSSTVREPGEYAVRGGILDLFPAGLDQPVRFDFFGDSLESIRSFDAETQRTLLDMRSLDLVPISEFQLVTETIRRFRMGYVAEFGAPERDDPLYEAVSEGRRHPGMEHWLPLFQERMDTLFDYLGDAPVAIEPQGEDAARERFKQIADYYEARREALEHPGGGAIYKPLPPDRLYLTEDEWTKRLDQAALARFTPFAVPDGSLGVVDAGARQGRNFAPERTDASINVFEAVVAHVQALQASRRKVVIALWSEGSRDRMGSMLRDHKLNHVTSVNSWRTVQATPRNEAMLAVVGMESGFETDQVAVISEQDILGDRLVRPRKASRKLDNFISEVTSLAAGDLVVHVEHGI